MSLIKYESNKEDDIIFTVRSLMQGREVGAIIGRGGDLVRQLRDESGAKIYISDASVPERIVTVLGTIECVIKAYKLITSKIQQYFERQNDNTNGVVPPLTFKLIVPAVQCGSIIGVSGCQIKELREKTGASIQVSPEMLPNSTERTVTIFGYPDNVTECILQICRILLEHPPRGNVIPYNPRLSVQNSLLAGLQDNLGLGLQKLNSSNPLASLLNLSGLSGLLSGGINTAALAAIAGSQLRLGNKRPSNVQTQEIMVPNEFIGSIIGKGGSKIAEIRKSSGANIRISANEDTVETEDGLKRPITITGTLDAIAIAKGLINISVDLLKANIEAQNSNNSDGSRSTHQSPPSLSSSTSSPSSMPIATILSKPVLNTLSNLTALSGLSELLSNVQSSRTVQTTGAHHPKFPISRFRNNASSGSGEKIKTERNKFAPY